MKRRTRIAGITLLVAMSLSLAQSAWASVCAGQMMGGADVASASSTPHMPEMPDMPEMPNMPADEDCAGGHAHGEEGNAPHQQDCPYAPAALGNGCTGAASVPAPTVVELPTLAIYVATAGRPALKPHSASSAAPFHPPKA